MKARLLRDSKIHVGNDAAGLPIFEDVPRGFILDHPEAFLQVRCGGADPADEECAKAAGMTVEQMAQAQRTWERANKGIRPEDFAAFDAGLIDGYDADGKPIPGPHAAQGSAQ
jgi:hypothetical protein